MSDTKYLGMTANKLAKIASELESENAKLRASNEVIAEDHAALCEQNAKLRETLQRRTEQLEGMTEMWVERGVENAKLRELVHLVAEYVSADRCEGCVAKRACNAGELDMCWIRKAILEKLRELGNEVDG